MAEQQQPKAAGASALMEAAVRKETQEIQAKLDTILTMLAGITSRMEILMTASQQKPATAAVKKAINVKAPSTTAATDGEVATGGGAAAGGGAAGGDSDDTAKFRNNMVYHAYMYANSQDFRTEMTKLAETHIPETDFATLFSGTPAVQKALKSGVESDRLKAEAAALWKVYNDAIKNVVKTKLTAEKEARTSHAVQLGGDVV